jgi:hypothetical protein
MREDNSTDAKQWAITTNDSLCEDAECHLHEGQEVSTETENNILNCWVRCELQTLFALSQPRGGRCWEEKQNAEDAEPLLTRRLTTSYPEIILQ